MGSSTRFSIEPGLPFHFDPEVHTYYVAERRTPGVTELLTRAGLRPRPFLSEAELRPLAERGTIVHKLCCGADTWTADDWKNYAVGRKSWLGLSNEALTAMVRSRLDCKPEHAGYVASYIRLIVEQPASVGYPWDATLTERPMYHDAFRFAGTPDRGGRLVRSRTVGDFKTGGPEAWHGLQLALYKMLIERETGESVGKRLGIYLKADGSLAKVREYRDAYDQNDVIAAITVAHAQQRLGIGYIPGVED